VTVHAISRRGIETTGVEIVTDRCLISIDAAKLGGQLGEREEINVKVVHHKVPWLEEVSSSMVRKISASLGIDLSGLVNKPEPHPDEPSQSELEATMQHLLDDRVLQYIKRHGLYGYTGPWSTAASPVPAQRLVSIESAASGTGSTTSAACAGACPHADVVDVGTEESASKRPRVEEALTLAS
jgi:hypothetical protein